MLSTRYHLLSRRVHSLNSTINEMTPPIVHLIKIYHSRTKIDMPPDDPRDVPGTPRAMLDHLTGCSEVVHILGCCWDMRLSHDRQSPDANISRDRW